MEAKMKGEERAKTTEKFPSQNFYGYLVFIFFNFETTSHVQCSSHFGIKPQTLDLSWWLKSVSVTYRSQPRTLVHCVVPFFILLIWFILRRIVFHFSIGSVLKQFYSIKFNQYLKILHLASMDWTSSIAYLHASPLQAQVWPKKPTILKHTNKFILNV